MQKNIIKRLIDNYDDQKVRNLFLDRLSEGLLTRDENPQTHFCVYFAAYDLKIKGVFVGHHKKSGLWLFNGGHIDKGETPEKAVEREIGEEWGLSISAKTINDPALFTITEIENPGKQICTRHYDIWYFVQLDKNNVNIDKAKLAKEFYENHWISLDKAKSLKTDQSTLKALDFLENKFKIK